jgi:bacillithiol synthase
MSSHASLTDAVDAGVLVRSTSLGGSVLSRALQARADSRVDGWMPRPPSTVHEWLERATDTRRTFAGRDWLTALAPAFAATGPAAQRLARAAESGVVVTTGQQPGLFGGPAYTWSKAISALAFADALEEAIGMPVAPVFWAATDDADWHEAATTSVVGPTGLEVLSLAGPPTDGVVLSDVLLGDTQPLFDRLRAACGSAASSHVLELAGDAYVPHATIGASYVQLLRGLLEPLGIAVLNAAHPAVRIAADPLLRRALLEAGSISAALAQRTRELTDAGFAPQVETIDSLSLVFRTWIAAGHADGSRSRERVPVTSASRVAREAEPGTLGPNVLLRPVIERALVPTVAYHAGPGEFAYFAQVGPVATSMDSVIPLAVPRWSGEIIEQPALRALERLGLDEGSLLSPHEAELRIARAAMDEETVDSLERLRLAVETQIRALADAVMQAEQLVDPAVLAGLERDLERRIARFERRILAATKRRESAKIRDLAVARAALRPLGQSPERVLNLVPSLARHGVELFERMRHAAREHVEQLVRGSPTSR